MRGRLFSAERDPEVHMIEVENLTKYYGDHAAIRELSFRIDKGEVIGFLGLNGAGKSTTLKILGCVLLPTSGRVTIDGFDVASDSHEVRKRIGFLPDLPPLYPEMTVADYLAFVARLRGVAAGDVAARVADAERKTATTEVHDEAIGTLSHGFRQRVGLAQAIVHNPALLILDEPASGLDPEQIVQMRALIRGLRGEHTILLSSHNLPEVSQTCDRLLIIDDGRIVASGTEEEFGRRLGGAEAILIDIATPGERAPVEHALQTLRQVSGVANASLVSEEAGVAHLRVEADPRLRPHLVRALVHADLDVLRVDLGSHLESIFLRLIRPEHGSTAKGGQA
jgi:ABC-2 type transport system ATP-binding protein